MLNMTTVIIHLLLCLMFMGPIIAIAVLPEDNEKIWAVLVAGSPYYSNYRHQADVCHAYQVLHEHGVSDDHIIVMMADDIAYDPANPTPGIVVNKPNGPDVYHGIPKDYTGTNVNSENFANILLGNETALKGIGSGKVLKSGPEDHVFIYYADHGGTGYLTLIDDFLYVDNFTKILLQMHQEDSYGKLVIYIEACYAGSMVDLLPSDIGIYAVTAVGPFEQAMGCCYDVFRGTLVGDLFSINWLEDSDTQDIRIETLDTQFAIVRQETFLSLVHRYGDLNIGRFAVGDFQGRGTSNNTSSMAYNKAKSDLVPSRDAPLYILKKRLEYATQPEDKKLIQSQIDQMLANREFMANTVKEIIKKAVKHDIAVEQILQMQRNLQDYECYGEVLEHFNNKCFSLSKNEYSSAYVHTLINMCESGIPSSTIKRAMDNVCTFTTITGIN